MSIESAVPPHATAVYRAMLVAGVVAAIVGAVTVGVIIFNFVTRPELNNPVPIEDAGHAQPPAWVTHT